MRIIKLHFTEFKGNKRGEFLFDLQAEAVPGRRDVISAYDTHRLGMRIHGDGDHRFYQLSEQNKENIA